MEIDDEAYLHDLVLNAPIGICVLDAATLTCEIVNESFLQVVGKHYDAIVGKYFWNVFAEFRQFYEAFLYKVIKTGKPYYAIEEELTLIRHGKEEDIVVSFVYSPLMNKEGQVKKVAVWILENTQKFLERKKLEEAAEKAAKSEEELRNMIIKTASNILRPKKPK
ncbi:PAS domain-containing protein [Pedobacter sp. P351]|uniref:PAS domain-containing protein n=1 Tax=Pedobacter superstes TaxID=3133441 RepID=UPI0030B5C571